MKYTKLTLPPENLLVLGLVSAVRFAGQVSRNSANGNPAATTLKEHNNAGCETTPDSASRLAGGLNPERPVSGMSITLRPESA